VIKRSRAEYNILNRYANVILLLEWKLGFSAEAKTVSQMERREWAKLKDVQVGRVILCRDMKDVNVADLRALAVDSRM
jgi:hypothetical protein